MPMSVETYRALGLDRQPMLEMNGRGAADFGAIFADSLRWLWRDAPAS